MEKVLLTHPCCEVLIFESLPWDDQMRQGYEWDWWVFQDGAPDCVDVDWRVTRSHANRTGFPLRWCDSSINWRVRSRKLGKQAWHGDWGAHKGHFNQLKLPNIVKYKLLLDLHIHCGVKSPWRRSSHQVSGEMWKIFRIPDLQDKYFRRLVEKGDHAISMLACLGDSDV